MGASGIAAALHFLQGIGAVGHGDGSVILMSDKADEIGQLRDMGVQAELGWAPGGKLL